MSSPRFQKELHTRGIVSSFDRAQSHMGFDCIITQCVGRNIEVTKRHFSHSRTIVTYGIRSGFVSIHVWTLLKTFAASWRQLLFRSNVPASVVRHDVPGNHSLIRNPTRIITDQSTASL